MRRLKLYIVDDSPYVRKSLVRIFSEIKNIDIIGEGENVKSATEFLSQNQPDVCLFDYYLSDGTALDLIKPATLANDNVIIVTISNFADDQIKKLTLRSGVNYFFDKANEIDQLTELIEKLASEIK